MTAVPFSVRFTILRALAIAEEKGVMDADRCADLRQGFDDSPKRVRLVLALLSMKLAGHDNNVGRFSPIRLDLHHARKSVDRDYQGAEPKPGDYTPWRLT